MLNPKEFHGFMPHPSFCNTRRHFEARLLAEQVCADAIAGARLTHNPMDSAWANIEAGLRHPENVDEYFASATAELSLIEPDTPNWYKAAAIRATMPMFRNRAEGVTDTAEDRAEAYVSLAGIAKNLKESGVIVESSQHRGVLGEIIATALPLRNSPEGVSSYLASTREDKSLIQRFNHDSYLLTPDGFKIPVQAKSHDKSYFRPKTEDNEEPEEVHTVYLRDDFHRLAGEELNELRQKTDRNNKILTVARLMGREANGILSENTETGHVLGILSNGIRNEILNFGDELRDDHTRNKRLGLVLHEPASRMPRSEFDRFATLYAIDADLEELFD